MSQATFYLNIMINILNYAAEAAMYRVVREGEEMSYVDEIYNYVVEKNPAQPEFHQAVKEVLESLRVVIEANEEEYRKDAHSREMKMMLKHPRSARECRKRHSFLCSFFIIL